MKPVLYFVIPCYNEEQVLPITSAMFLEKLNNLIKDGRISEESRILFVDDGSNDGTHKIITDLVNENGSFCAISLSRNMGHQNALLAGLEYSVDRCDITVSVDCDGQDDINAVDRMLCEYASGCDIVYGVRSKRDTDTFFKEKTAHIFYSLMRKMGTDVIYDHADYRLVSARALKALLEFKEVNLFLRGMFPMVGFKSCCVPYERKERIAGKSKYSFVKMLRLAIDGITSLSVKPIRLITAFGSVVALVSFVGIIWSVIRAAIGATVIGWASTVCIICFLGGIQLLSLGVIGEYVGKIYLETKSRPRYIIKEEIWNKKE